MLKKLKNLIIIFSILIAMSVAVNFAFAQSADNLLWGGTQNEIGNTIGLGSEDPRILAANIIRVALGFLGIIAVGLVMYAGFLWMTAAGNMERIEKAKKVLSGAVIGLLIILISFSIVTFILSKFLAATGGACVDGDVKSCGCAGLGTQTCVGEVWTDCSYTCAPVEVCCSWGCDTSCVTPPEFHVNSTSPDDGDTNVIRNIKVRYTSNLFIGGTNPVDDTTFTVTDGGGAPISGVREVDGKRIIFTPDGACGINPCGATDCFNAGEQVTVTAVDGPAGVLSVGDVQLSCPGAGIDCAITFDVGNLIDCEDPAVNLGLGQICAVPDNDIFANSTDDNGVDNIEFLVDGISVDTVVNPSSDSPFDAGILWDGSSYAAGDLVILTATAYDIDSNSASDNETIMVKADHCCNGVQDIADGEEGIDCGGECGACEGSACAIDAESLPAASCSDDLCASGFCSSSGSDAGSCSANGYDTSVSDCCLCQNSPIIDWVAPEGGFCDDDNNVPCQDDSDCGTTCDIDTPNGADGNLVTIGGRYFDDIQGTGSVVFDDGVGTFTASLADTVNPSCVGGWQDRQIIVVVPAGLDLGPGTTITVTADNGFSDNTQSADGRGPDLDFVVNTISRPGLCLLSPNNGIMDDTITYEGIRLNGATARFGNVSSFVNASDNNFPVGLTGTADVPNVAAGNTTSFVISPLDINSNYLNFRKNAESEPGPYITSFEPVDGAPGQYVTIYGSGFGNTKRTSQVFFGDEFTGAEADYNFPAICADSVWGDNQIIVKVPAMADANEIITVVLGLDAINTNELTPSDFQIDSLLDLFPSLCKIQPVMGPTNSDISLWGEYFGAQATGLVRFYLNNDQSGAAISYWGADGDAQKIDTTVHNDAASGQVRVVQSGDEGNGLNFTVGLCTEADNPDDACGIQICCPAGTYEEGRCRAAIDDCYADISSSVYEWDFSTDAGGGIGDNCDLDGNSANGCQDDGSCGTGLVCETSSCTCQPPGTCAGYGLSQCQDAEFCPNSPGQCSMYPGGEIVDDGGCSDADCGGVGACAAPPCVYNIDLNKCVDNTQGDCDLDSITQDVFGNDITQYCAVYGKAWEDDGNYIAAWQFNENPSGPAPQILDSTSDNNDGTVNGGMAASDSVVGISNNALDFDGIDDYINIDDSASFDLGAEAVTFAFWFKLDANFNSSTAVTQPLITKYASNANNFHIFLVGTNFVSGNVTNGAIAMKIESTGNWQYISSTQTSWLADTWYYAVFTRNGAARNVYINGVDNSGLLEGSNGSLANFNSITGPLRIGGDFAEAAGSYTTGYFRGVIDEVSISNVVRSAEWVSDQYMSQSDNYTVWHINTGASCPTGWTRISGDRCVDSITTDTCSICGSGFACLDDNDGDNEGICGVNQDICLNGSICDDVSERCESLDAASCECCCEIGQDARDCCTGLVCGGSCGGDLNPNDASGFGECSGCRIEVGGAADQDLSNAACNCEGTFGKYCELDDVSYPGGVCRDAILGCSPPDDLCDDSVCCSTTCEGPPGSTVCPTACEPSEEECGNACCSTAAGGCLDPAANLCADCDPGESLCDDNACCDVSCEGPDGATYCPTNPEVEAVSPENGTVNACRNALVTADFNQKMDIPSFGGNVIMVGDYGTALCPEGTEYLAINSEGVFNRTWQEIKRFVAKILSPIFPKARALSNNFCAISGSVSGFYSSISTTTLVFSPKDLLDADRKYYVIIQGDGDINDDNNTGVLSYNGISMADDWRDIDGTDLTISEGGAVNLIDRTLNGKEYYGYVWSFTTMAESSPGSGICKIDNITITPDSYLFKTAQDDIGENDADSADSSFDTVNDGDKAFTAMAITSDGQALSEVAGVYEWNWSWGSDNTAVVDFDSANPFPMDSYRQLYEADSGITDGRAVLSAVADVSGSAEDGVESYAGEADAWVFICENPWPPIDMSGTWTPWRDEVEGASCLGGTGDCFDVNYEFYYCRDTGGTGTQDDLPAILSDSTIIRGSSTAQNLLKEFYFLREDAPDVSSGMGLAAEDLSATTEGVVRLTWVSIGADGYKAYYGASPGSYSDYIDVGNVLTEDIYGLAIGRTYYFAVTAYDDTGAESDYSNEVSIIPEDTTPPAPPVGLVEDSACEGELLISWGANTDDAVGYKVYYGASSGSYGGSYDVDSATSATLTGLVDGNTYYIVVTAYDSYDNESAYSGELEIEILPSC